ncbi:MAG: exodeoxyribonuclease VII large subunit [Gammaproteobacteria bacterium]|nr:MAG: exodeoxyribonuclease VII large subunit [Gammaproteobacteria bacterium]
MTQQHILQVSELTKKVRFLIESELNTVWLTGEISNFIAASSGHWYLSLKDAKSQVKCAMFKGSNRRVRITPRNGQQVLVRAKVSLYEPRGDFQLIIEQMEDAGTGLLRQKFEQLKEKLTLEGLFSLQYKKSVPEHITRVGVVTSPTGAAVKDILTVLQRRNPSIEVIVYPSLVQGDSAAAQISQAIEVANTRAECDVLIVGRGGGSLEDLWCFNEECVVRTIFASKLPIISAVGHEIDTTLSDYVADLRSATPSAAAELVSQDSDELLHRIKQLKQRLLNNITLRQSTENKQLLALQHRLGQVHPEQKLQLQQQKCDDLSIRLTQAMSRELTRFKQQPLHLSEQLQHLSPAKNIHYLQQLTQQKQQRLTTAIQHNLATSGSKFAALIEQLHLISPLATLARGYSITWKNNQLLKSVQQVSVDDTITVQLNDGEISAKVVAK